MGRKRVVWIRPSTACPQCNGLAFADQNRHGRPLELVYECETCSFMFVTPQQSMPCAACGASCVKDATALHLCDSCFDLWRIWIGHDKTVGTMDERGYAREWTRTYTAFCALRSLAVHLAPTPPPRRAVVTLCDMPIERTFAGLRAAFRYWKEAAHAV